MFLAVALLLPSCAGMVQRRVAVEGVGPVSRLGWSGADAVLTVRNDLGRDVTLDSCRITFRTASGTLAQAELRGGATVARRSAGSVRLRLKITSDNPSAMQALWRRLAGGDIDGVVLDIDAEAHIGRRRHKIYAEGRSLSEILSNFGVPNSEFATYFQ